MVYSTMPFVKPNNLQKDFRIQSITTKFLTNLNSVINGLIKELFTLNFPVAQLEKHKTEDLRRAC